MELKTCPFCGSDHIKLSVKKSTSNYKTIHHVSYYCTKCNCYGPRVLYKPEEQIWIWEENLPEEIKEKAVEAWNNRK